MSSVEGVCRCCCMPLFGALTACRADPSEAAAGEPGKGRHPLPGPMFGEQVAPVKPEAMGA